MSTTKELRPDAPDLASVRPAPQRSAPRGALSAQRLAASTHRLPPAPTPSIPAASSAPVQIESDAVVGLHERRRRRRASVPPMYTSAIVRMLALREEPIEGHVLDLSETGMALEVDSLIGIGQPVTIEFRVAGLGRIADDGEWMPIAAAGEVVRHDNLDDFPNGPYKIAIRFARIATMSQAAIARFVATHPS